MFFFSPILLFNKLYGKTLKSAIHYIVKQYCSISIPILYYTVESPVHYMVESPIHYMVESPIHHTVESPIHYMSPNILYYTVESPIHYTVDSTIYYMVESPIHLSGCISHHSSHLARASRSCWRASASSVVLMSL